MPNSWLNGAAKFVYSGIDQSDLTGGTQPAQLAGVDHVRRLLHHVDEVHPAAVAFLVVAEMPKSQPTNVEA